MEAGSSCIPFLGSAFHLQRVVQWGLPLLPGRGGKHFRDPRGKYFVRLPCFLTKFPCKTCFYGRSIRAGNVRRQGTLPTDKPVTNPDSSLHAQLGLLFDLLKSFRDFQSLHAGDTFQGTFRTDQPFGCLPLQSGPFCATGKFPFSLGLSGWTRDKWDKAACSSRQVLRPKSDRYTVSFGDSDKKRVAHEPAFVLH